MMVRNVRKNGHLFSTITEGWSSGHGHLLDLIRNMIFVTSLYDGGSKSKDNVATGGNGIYGGITNVTLP